MMETPVNSTDSMACKFLLAYYYVSPHDGDRLDQFKQVSGDSDKTLVTQFVRGWIGRNRSYYLDLARQDAIARNISFPHWGEIVVNQGIEALPPYQQEVRDIGTSPLSHVPLSPDVQRRNVNYLLLGKQNIALLRVAILYDRDNAIGFVSRVVKEQLDRNWTSLYQSQVDAEDFSNWK